MDIGLICDEGAFKLRASGVIVKNNKMLVAKSRRFDGYVFFGGHIMLGENSRDAIVRETREELGFEVQINRLVCVNENIFRSESGGISHEISFYYLLEPVQDIVVEDFEYHEVEDDHEFVHKYVWIDIEEAKKNNVRPHWLADMILEGRENYYYLTDQVKSYE